MNVEDRTDVPSPDDAVRPSFAGAKRAPASEWKIVSRVDLERVANVIRSGSLVKSRIPQSGEILLRFVGGEKVTEEAIRKRMTEGVVGVEHQTVADRMPPLRL